MGDKSEARRLLSPVLLDASFAAVSSSRIKLTCIDASKNYTLVGANTGSLYLFDRETARYIQLISIDGIHEPIAMVKISPDEKYLALVTYKARVIVVMEFNTKMRRSEKELQKITAHKADITGVIWAGAGHDLRVFSSDESGALCRTPLFSKKALFSSLDSEFLYQCDTRVVQLEYDEETSQLLASSLTRSIVIDFARGAAFQVGSKLRDGPFGGTHYRSHVNGTELLVARPGKRLWTADIDSAKVKQTLNFQPSLDSTPPTRLFSDGPAEVVANANFSKLVQFGECVLSWGDRIIFVIDADNHRILQWHTDPIAILDVAVERASVFILYTERDTTHVARVEFDLRAFVDMLVKEKNWTRIVQLVRKYDMEDLDYVSLLGKTAEESGVPTEVVEELSKHVKSKVAQRHAKEAVIREQEQREAAAAAEEAQRKQKELEEEQRLQALAAQQRTVTPSSPVPVPSRSLDSSDGSPSEPASVEDGNDDLRSSSTSFHSRASSGSNTPNDPSPLENSTISREGSMTDMRLDDSLTLSRTDSSEFASSGDTNDVMVVTKRKKVGRKKPRVADIAPPSTKPQFPSPLLAEMQQRGTTPPPSTSGLMSSAGSPPTNGLLSHSPATVAPAPVTLPAPSPPRQPVITQPQATVSPIVQPQPVHAKPVPLNPQISTFNPDQLSSSPPSATSTPPPHSVSPANGSSSGVAANVRRFISTDKALDEMKNLARKVIDLPSVFTALTAPKPTEDNGLKRSSSWNGGAGKSLASNEQPKSNMVVDERSKKLHDAILTFKDAQRLRGTKNFDDKDIRRSLSEWINAFDTSSPPIAPEGCIADILTACLELGVAPSLTASSKSWTDTNASAFINRYGKFMNVQDALFVVNERQWPNSVSALLSQEEAAYQARDRQSFNVHFASREQLEALLETESPDATGALSKLVTKSDLALTLHHLPRLIKLAPEATINFSASLFPSLRPWNVEQHLQLPEDLKLLVEFYTKLLRKHPASCTDPEIVHRWVELCLIECFPSGDHFWTTDKMVNDRKVPVRGSHETSWRHDKFFDSVINGTTFSFVPEALITLFDRYGHVRGLFAMLVRTKQFARAAEIAIFCDDASAFTKLVRIGGCTTVPFWKRVIQLLSSRGMSESAKIGHQQLVEALVHTLGPQRAISTLMGAFGAQDCSLESVESLPTEVVDIMSDLPSKVYKDMLHFGRVDLARRNLIHEAVEIVDSYLWSMRPPVMAPSFRALETAEIQERKLEDNCLNDVPFVASAATLEGTFDWTVNFPYKPRKRFFAEHAGHWGNRVSLRTVPCQRCAVPLHENVGSGKLYIFPECGHAYHDCCVEEDACPKCVKITSLL